jgi:4a-hydroxytetrahydrobiopterin dehydratase
MADDVLLSDGEVQEALKDLPGWELKEGWIRRTYSTPGWPHTLLLVGTIGYLAEAAYHHPDLTVGYAKLTVKLQTHRVGGITGKDLALARLIDGVALWKPEPDSPLEGFPKNWVR